VRVWTDSSAAIGISTRQGLGKLRHLDTHTLWIQQAVRTGKIDLRKVLGEVNPADLFTKHSLSRERLKGLVTLYDCHFRSGRAESAPKMRTEAADKKTISDADLATVGERLIFPHLEYARPLLDRLYPPMAVPDAVDAGDPQQDEDDPILVEGYRLAQELIVACDTHGRRRRLQDYDTCKASHPSQYACSGTPAKGDSDQQQPDGEHLKQQSGTEDVNKLGKYPLSTLTVVPDRSAGRHIAPLKVTTFREHPWLASSSRTRPTVRGTTRHGPSLLQPQGASGV
jgi:hypothetical protein